jgi:hypothetical protein
MADIVDLPGEILETRYATQHVGGAFDAKNIPKPKTIEKAAEDARWNKDLTSIYLVGFNPTPYVGPPKIVAGKIEPIGTGIPGIYLPKPFTPTPPGPFGPLIDAPLQAIVWDTDLDNWEYSGSAPIGQTFWDS